MFKPILNNYLVGVFLSFPYPNIEFSIDELQEEEWHKGYSDSWLYDELQTMVNESIKPYGEIKETSIYGDIHYTIEVENIDFVETNVLPSIEKACRKFWRKYGNEIKKHVK